MTDVEVITQGFICKLDALRDMPSEPGLWAKQVEGVSCAVNNTDEQAMVRMLDVVAVSVPARCCVSVIGGVRG